MSGFQYENVILPDGPVMLVNRDWQIPGRKLRKSRKSSVGQFGGKVHSFRVKDSEVCSSKFKLQPPSSKNTASPTTEKTASRSYSGSSQHRKVQDQDRWHQKQASVMRQSPLSDSSSYDGNSIEMNSLDVDDYNLIPDSRTRPSGQRLIPGVDACLIKMTNYETPSFIPKAYYFSYYVENIGDLMYPLKGLYMINPLRHYWLPIVLVDELWFYCILYTVARHLNASADHRSYDRECVYLADLVYSKLRRRLEMSTNGDSLTDVDCAAVACLLSVEHACGSKETLGQHAKGLASFIDKRGGVDSIGSGLRTKICRADIEAAIDISSEPAITYPSDTEPLASRLNLPGPAAHFTAHPAYDLVLSHLSAPLSAIAVDFLSFVQYLQLKTTNLQLLDPFILDDSVLSIQHRLIRYNNISLSPLDHAFRAACLIFIKCLTKPLNKVSSTSDTLVICLRQHTNKIDSSSRPLFIWLLFMGQIAGRQLCEERIVMSSMLADELRKQAGGSFPPWSTLKRFLRQIAWVDAIFDGVGEEVWVELDAVSLV